MFTSVLIALKEKLLSPNQKNTDISGNTQRGIQAQNRN